MEIRINTTANVQLREVLKQCSLGQLLKELYNADLDTADYVGLGLFLNSLCEEGLRHMAYGIDDITAQSIIEGLKFYGKDTQ